jgi:hypothetical protein
MVFASCVTEQLLLIYYLPRQLFVTDMRNKANKYVIGLDFGTNSCRALVANAANELASHVFAYPSGDAGVMS